jgi:hypothetical protein
MCKHIPGQDQDPAFFIPQGKRKIPVSYHNWQSWLKYLIEASGRNPAKFASHSFRRGGASFAFQAGVPVEIIKILGDWKSDAFYHYLQVPMLDKAKAAEKISKHIVKNTLTRGGT